MIAALFVATDGCYFGLPDVDPWDIKRDARLYAGPHPVVAHPPCQLWVNLAAVNWKRYHRERPAWYPGGNDGGCFANALAAVRMWGGVLEHPANTHAWQAFDLSPPICGGWQRSGWAGQSHPAGVEWTAEIWQSAYGHRARKRTWLLYVGAREPPSLRYHAKAGDAQVGWFDRNKPTLNKREANATPIAFRDLLLSIAKTANVTPLR